VKLAGLTVLAGLALNGVAHAEPQPQWVGLWTGTIGRYPVEVCLDTNGVGTPKGSYYYLNRLEPISLQDASGGRFKEESGGVWTLRNANPDQLSGTWQGKRTLTVTLKRESWTPHEVLFGPCGSREFMAPRLGPIAASQKPATGADFDYDVVTYDAGPAFGGLVSLESFSVRETLPGDHRINLLVMLDPLHEGSEEDFVSCLSGNLSWLGIDGDFYYAITPRAVKGDFLTGAVNIGSYCGGAHPNSDWRYRTFDRRTGAEFDISRWLSEAAFAHNEVASGEATPGPVYSRELSAAMLKLALARFPMRAEADDGDGCNETVAETNWWSIELVNSGLAFRPSLPHVSQACGDAAVVPFAELAPFLSDDGKAGAARIAAVP
jgi:hypothetical protein